MWRGLNSKEPRRPVKQWQTSIHSTVVEGPAIDCLIVTNVTLRGAWDGRPWCASIVLCARSSPGLNTLTYSAPVPLNRRHTHQQGGEETHWELTGGLLVLWIGSPWCQPSDDSHVDEVNFLLAKWEQILAALGCICLLKQSFNFIPRVDSIYTLILWVWFSGSRTFYQRNILTCIIYSI